MSKDWIKLHVNPWLYGSTRDELSPAERSVWIDLLVLAGHFSKNGVVGEFQATRATISRNLNISPTLLNRTLTKCEKYGKISVNGDKITIIKWAEYQTTGAAERWERWAEKHPDEAKRDRHKHPQTPTNQEREREREREKEKKENITPPISPSFEKRGTNNSRRRKRNKEDISPAEYIAKYGKAEHYQDDEELHEDVHENDREMREE